MKMAIVDDEQFFVEELYKNIEGFYCDSSIDKFTDPILFLEEMQKTKYDLVFLDIEMPVISGLELSKIIGEKFENTYVIFVSNRDDLVFQAINRNVIAFVRKIHFAEDWLNVQWKIQDLFDKKQVTLKTNLGFVTMNRSDVLFYATHMRRIVLSTIEHKKHRLIYPSLKDVDRIFESNYLFKINKSTCINMNYIVKYDYPKVMLRGSDEVFYISKHRRSEFLMKYANTIL